MLSSVFLATAGVFSGICWLLSKGTERRLFWLICALGLLFLSVDERMGLHERAHNDWLYDAYGDAPFGMRNWNDLIVAGYGVIALIGGMFCLPTFMRFRWVRTFLIAGFVFYVCHTLIDSLLDHTRTKMVWEESCKALAGASFLSAFLHGVLAERHERAKRGESGSVLKPRHAVLLLSVAAVLAAVVLSGDKAYQKWLRNHWGSTHSWVVAVFWMGSAITLFAAWLERPRRAFYFVAAGFAWLVGVGESWRATRGVFWHDGVQGVFPVTIRWDVDAMHEPFELEGYLFLGGLVALIAWGAWALRGTRTAGWFLAAALLSAGGLTLNLVFPEWGNDIGGPVLRILGGACLFFGSLLLLLTSSRSSPAAPSTPSGSRRRSQQAAPEATT